MMLGMLVMYSMHFVVVTLLFQLLAEHSWLLYHASDLLTNASKYINEFSGSLYTTPTLLALQS